MNLVPVAAPLKSQPPNRRNGGSSPVAEEFVVTGAVSSKWAKNSGGPAGDAAYNLVWHENKGGSFTVGETARALRAGASHSYQGVGVRRLTPTECARLQGFPDDWLDGSDGAKYRALGNAVTVPVAEWIGKRLLLLIGGEE